MTLGGGTTLRGYTLGSSCSSGATLRGRRTLGDGTNTTPWASCSAFHITLKIFLEFGTHIYILSIYTQDFYFYKYKK
jgi:hypothetical protein